MEYKDRKWLFKSLVGSHNYNLNTETSDKDYKVFVLPTFDDLYYGEKVSKSETSEKEDFAIHDIRMLTNMLYKSNVNFIEVLFSKELVINDEFLFTDVHDFIIKLINNREEYAKMNLPYLWNACIGMYHQNRSKMMYVNFNEEKNLTAMFNSKKAMTAYRILDFLERYALFLQHEKIDQPFKMAIYYYDNDEREMLLKIKNEAALPEVKTLLDYKLEKVETNYKDFYKESKVNEKLKLELEKDIKKLIYENI